EGSCLNEEADRLGDGHEKSLRFRMRNCDRTAIANLLLENGNDTAPASEDVAKAHAAEAGTVAPALRLHDHFSHTLRGAHDAGGVDGFVGGNLYEPGCAKSEGLFDEVSCAADIVEDRFAGVDFHQVNVFVGGGMKD